MSQIIFVWFAPIWHNILHQKVYAGGHFWSIFVKIFDCFWKIVRSYYELSGRIYSKLSRYFFLISKEYSITILDAGETSKSFNVNIRGFWDFDFFLFPLQNFPMEKPSQNEQKNQNFNFIIKYFWRWCMFKMLLKVFSSCFLSKINVFSYGYHFSTKKIHCSTIKRISSKLA